ncbi:cell division protein FtsQ/DivIB [Alicyclobacillus acidiphilus]|uniref:cell division protein FtsQ/DivIB n=1 Tax=Alicyclobacillus acidiphilus TaxID=182455 RepID=UPI000831DBDA|nr:FtsQ-type POTRA domain-containing protein [Alicyclobacillus acidiphilus]
MPQATLTPEARERRKSRNRKIVMGFFVFIGLIVLLESPLARVRRVAVSGNTTIQSSVLVSASGLRSGQSLWQVNPNYTSRRIVNAVPMVQSSNVHTDWLNGTVYIQVQERHVVAIYEVSGKFYELLNNGYVYDEITPNQGFSFPVITGAKPAVQVHEIVSPDVAQVCRQLAKMNAEYLAEVSEFHVNGDGTVSIYLDNGFVVDADISTLLGAMNAMTTAVNYFVQKGYKPGTVDLTGQPPYRYTPFSANSTQASADDTSGSSNGTANQTDSQSTTSNTTP